MCILSHNRIRFPFFITSSSSLHVICCCCGWRWCVSLNRTRSSSAASSSSCSWFTLLPLVTSFPRLSIYSGCVQPFTLLLITSRLNPRQCGWLLIAHYSFMPAGGPALFVGSWAIAKGVLTFLDESSEDKVNNGFNSMLLLQKL